MRVLVLHAHPLGDSLNGALKATIVKRLQARGHEVDLCDLYGEGFNPVLDADARRRYFDTGANRAGVEPYIERLFAAQALVLSFPVWCFGPPAILKGFMDRVMIPGVSFKLDDAGVLRPNLTHLKRLVAVTTYGRNRLEMWWMGDPPRNMVKRYLRWFVANDAVVTYLPLYGIHQGAGNAHGKFIERVGAEMDRF